MHARLHLWDGPAVLLPRQRAKLAWGAKDKEHAMSQTPNTAIAVIGIDIGKNSFHVVGHDARAAEAGGDVERHLMAAMRDAAARRPARCASSPSALSPCPVAGSV